MATWEDRLEALMACGVFKDVPDKDILLQGDPTAGTPTWPGEMAFSMPIQQYLNEGKIVGALNGEGGGRGTLESIDPKAAGQIIVVNGKPSTSLLHRLGAFLNLPLEVIPGHYAALNWVPLRAIPSRVVKPPTIRIVSVGLLRHSTTIDEWRKRPCDIGLGSQEKFSRISIGDQLCCRIDYLDLPSLTFCAVEQHVSFYAYYESQNTWSGLLLCDIGKGPAPGSLPGFVKDLMYFDPRTSQPLRFQPWKNYNHILVPNFDDLETESQHPRPFEWRLSMNETMSTEQRNYCQEDPFAFMADLLETSALSWIRLLSYLQAEVTGEKKLDMLQSEKEISSRASTYFTEVISFLVDRKTFFTTQCSEAEDRQRVDGIAVRLLKDFEFLRQEADRLSRDRSEGISMLMSTMSIHESRKGLEDARRVRLVTYLAFVFIPLSFVSSVFGMNVREFSDSGPGIWLFFAIAGPLTLVCLCWPIWLEFSEEMKKKLIPFWMGLIASIILRFAFMVLRIIV